MLQNVVRDSLHSAGNISSGGGGDAVSLERLRTMLSIPPANRPPDWTNPLEKIEQLLTCAICLDRYKNPKLLPCQHSFCMDPCLDGLVDIVRRLVRCPECRAEHPLPYDGVKAFQTNYTLMGFLEIHLQATEENASELESYIRRFNMERCKVCDEKSEVDYCSHCEKRICLECKSTHIDMLKRDLGRLMNQVKRLCTRISDTADTLARGVDSLTVNCDNVKEEIRDYVKRYIKELKKREDALLSEVETFFNGETRMIKTVRDNLELESGNINEACARVEACLKGDREMSDEELVRYKQMFAEGLEYLRTVNPDADDLTNKKIRFVVNDAHLLPHAITQFGELQVCTPQYSHKLAQAEQIYVPRFLQLGLESDNYAVKRRSWNPNDAHTWNQQQPSIGKMQPQSKQVDDDAYSSRYKRRQMLEEQAWNRIRGENPQSQRQQGSSMKRTVQEEHGNARTTTSQFDNSPWSRMQTLMPPSSQTEASTAPVSPANSESCLSTVPPTLPSSNSTGMLQRARSMLQPPQKSLPKKKWPVDQTAGEKSKECGHQRQEGEEGQDQQRVQEIVQRRQDSSGIKESLSSSGQTEVPKPPPRMQKPVTTGTSLIEMVESGTANNGSTSDPGIKANGSSSPKEKSPSEDRELDKRVDNIRKEYEKRQNEQQKTILQIQQRIRTHQAPADVASAMTASSEEEEEEDSDNENGEFIPVYVYPTPVATVQEIKKEATPAREQSVDRPLRVNTNDNATSAGVSTNMGNQRKSVFPFSKPPIQKDKGMIDWKKYLIPSPPDNSAKRMTNLGNVSLKQTTSLASSSTTNESVQRSSESTTPIPRPVDTRTSNTDDLSWTDRRKRFVRSKTNPDFSTDVSNNVTTTEFSTRINRFSLDDTEQRKRRFGFRNETGSNQESNTAKESVEQQRSSPVKSRYRRKAERSHSGFAMPNLQNDENAETQRCEISIGNSDVNGASCGPGARFYRVFTNPKVDYLSKGRCLIKFGNKGTGDGQFNWPRGVAIMPMTEEIVVCDSSNHRLQIFDKRGRFMKTLGTYGSNKAEFDCLAGVCVNKYRQYVITDRYNHRVQIFDSTGRHLREFGAHGQTNGRFNSPWGVAVDQQGFIYVCDKDNHRVQIFQADGNFVGKFGGIGNREGQFQNPHFVACNRQNQVIVTDSSNHRIQIFDHNGHFLFLFGSEGFHDGQFKYPRGVAVDEQGFILVADSGNNRIQIFYPDGRFYSTFGIWGSGDGQLKGVEGVAVMTDGRIVVTDRENHRVQIF